LQHRLLNALTKQLWLRSRIFVKQSSLSCDSIAPVEMINPSAVTIPAVLLTDRYAKLRPTITRVQDRASFSPQRIPTELELQARWFAGEFGTTFTSTSGQKIEIVQFGTWNREAGPDFRDVAIRLDGAGPIRGCVEIDLIDRSWETHGHATNPEFEQTVLHVFFDKTDREFFTRTKFNRNVPQVRIDLAAFPQTFSATIPLARPGRCQAPLQNLPEERVCSLLSSAAQFRLRKKAAQIRNKIESHGFDEALFQELAAALGYKANKLPFTLIAQRLSLKFLRHHAADAEALLFGVAGFLEAPDLGMYKTSAKQYLRDLWDRWWPHRDELQRFIIPPKLWRITGTRPINHPQRRLAALSLLAREWTATRRALEKKNRSAAEKFFGSFSHPFWNVHYTLTSDPALKPMALIGESRVADILANVLFPIWISDNLDVWPEYAKLTARLSNRRLETGATRLFGDDPRRRDFLKTVAHQQGLLQIYEDFCLQDNSDCAHCPFPEQLQKWK
jgi:hypothetical protein